MCSEIEVSFNKPRQLGIHKYCATDKFASANFDPNMSFRCDTDIQSYISSNACLKYRLKVAG